MSAASLFLAKNYGQYVISVESELANPHLTSQQKALLYSNIAIAQYELGLNRKAIKSSQNSIDLFFSTDTADSMGVYCYLRACVVKGKALLSSGKVSDAVQAWSDGVVKAVSFGPTVVVDVGLLMELNSLVEVNRTDTNEASVVLSVAAPTAAAMVAPEQLSPMPSPASPVKAASQPVSPSKPANATNSTESVQVETAAVSVQAAPTLPAVPPRPATKAPQRSATSNKMTAPAAPTSTATSTTVASTAPAAVDDAAAEQAAKEIYRSAMMAIHRRSIGDSDEHAIKPFYLNAIRANLPHICGEPLVDDLICLSYINVNSGNLEAASSIFKLLNEYRTDLPAALIGAGSIAAMQRNFDEAIAQFTRALSINDTIADAWKRRGQTRAAKGLIKTALKDLTKAIALIPQDADCYNQRGLVYHQTRNYTRALADFKAAHARGLASAALLNNLGMCEGQLGFVQPSIDAHLKAIRVEPTFKEAHLNVALMHKEAGDWANALVAFDSAIKCDSKPFFQAYGHRGLMYAQLGRPAAALKDLLLAINVLFSIVKSADGGAAGAGAGVVTYTAEEKNTRRNELVLNLVRAAMCYQQLGQYHKSTGFIDQALSMHPGHTCWFQKEIGLFLWTGVDVDLSLYNLDDRTDPRLKDGWCKHANFDYMVVHRIGSNPASTIQPLPVTPGVPAPVLGVGCYGLQRKPAKTPVLYRYSDAIPCDEDGEQIPTAGAPASPAASAEVKKSRCAYDPTEGAVQSMRDERAKLQLVQQTMPIARWIQLDSPGFLPNRRQHRMFGVAVLQMAMSLTRHLSLISLEGIGLLIPDVVSSRAATTTATPAAAVATSTATSSAPALQISKVSPNMAVVSSSTAARLSAPSSSRGGSPSGKRGATKTHTFNWRDLYDIAVRWRQVSEPGDPVWWIDRFPAKAFEEGFGLQTPLVNGHLTTVRYEPYYEPAFDRVKDILQQRGYYTVSDQFVQLDADERQTVGEARTLAQLRAAVGRDFYVVVPCPSLRSPSAGLVLEGTRLTLLTQEPEGFDFTIRTPGKPYRWSQYEGELSACFHRLEEAFLQLHHCRTCTNTACALHPTTTDNVVAGGTADVLCQDATPAEMGKACDEDEDQLILRPALELFYLWATFAPLSRGTAACGYAALCAVLLAFGKQVSGATLLPKGKQLDWEAILAVDFDSFWLKVRSWFKLVPAIDLMAVMKHPWRTPALKAEPVTEDAPSDGPSEELESGGQEGPLDCVRTLRDMLDVMNLPYGN